MSQPKTLLFVDDDPAFLFLISQFEQSSQGRWRVVTADSPAKALGMLTEHNFDMLVVDERMPVMNGLEFARLARMRLPQVRIAVLTGYTDDQSREQLIREGVEVVLEKPAASEAFHTLFLTLDQLLTIERQHGFRGVMHDVQLQDIIQLECLRRNSSVLEVFSKRESGEIYIHTGRIVHAAVGILKGEPAFNHLLNLKDGEFRLKPYLEPAEQTISRQSEMLLMESAQMRDEVDGRATGADLAEAAPVAESTLPPVELTEAERAMVSRTLPLLAVSIEGRVLTRSGEPKASLAAPLATLVRDAAWFKSAAGLGALELFEFTTPTQDSIVHFQPESGVWVSQPRVTAP
jgi:CheY-like chemotaxis protein